MSEGGEDLSGGIKKPKPKKSEALWMLSFSDLCLILMCFFALMLSFSTINSQKFDNVSGNMSAKIDAEKKKEKNLKAIEESVNARIKKKKDLKKSVQVKLDSDGLAIEFNSALLFSSGSANANPRYRKVVREVLEIIADSPKKYQISLEGHTDDARLSGRGKYRSNWELSSARGVTLLNEFKQMGVPEGRMYVMSFAHTKPKVKYRRLKGRRLMAARAKNRRVVIRLR